MIAKLTLPGGIVAIMDDEGEWTCPNDPGFADDLNLLERFNPRLDYSPALGTFGHAHATAAQKAFGGDLWLKGVDQIETGTDSPADSDDDDDDKDWDWRPIRGVDPPVWIGFKKPARHPDFDKIVQLCREALPGAIEEQPGDGLEFREQEEPAVFLLVQEGSVQFRLPTILWPHPHTPVAASRALFDVPFDGLSTDWLRSFIEKARDARRAEIRPCHFCGEPTPTEHAHEMNGRWVCHGCAERHLNVQH